MELRPVLDDPAVVVDAVSDLLGAPLTLQADLDVDVYRLRGADGQPDVVARAFGPAVERATVDAAARVLRALADTKFPAERCVDGDPVVTLDGDRRLLVTQYVEPVAPPGPGFVLAWCAGLLGHLAKRSGDDLPPGGGWHRLGATPSEEIDEALRLAGDLGAGAAELVDALADADDAAGLPETLIHADLTPPNAVPQGRDRPVVIDWIGVGRGPRVWPLAFLLVVAGPRAAPPNLERYERSVTLTDEERQRLPGVMAARPLTLDLWSAAHERLSVRQAVTRHRARRTRIAAVCSALGLPER